MRPYVVVSVASRWGCPSAQGTHVTKPNDVPSLWKLSEFSINYVLAVQPFREAEPESLLEFRRHA